MNLSEVPSANVEHSDIKQLQAHHPEWMKRGRGREKQTNNKSHKYGLFHLPHDSLSALLNLFALSSP